ncbi:MAG: sigma-54-dependent Fis family transcriptional regulator [Hyphomicrobiales bacterium]|nr:sigma-54-dependent Fis family transcriptional regulator [Hyphomicrobiales bacterium]
MNVAHKPIVLVIDDDATLNKMLCGHLKESGYDAVGAHRWREAEALLARVEPSVILLDIKLPDANGIERLRELTEVCPVLVLTAYGSIDQAVQAIKHGAIDYLTKPVNPEGLDLAVSRTVSISQLQRNYEYYRRQSLSEVANTLVGTSAAMAELRRLIGIVGPADTTVLVLGESGVGKELVAASVHQASRRAGANFVAVDCSTIQQNLFESELFGHERGAFTGADRRKEGLIEVANGGTVFLDEIGEMSPALQAKLLRVLETGRFRRVGGTKDLHADVRFIAATNRDLDSMCSAGSFREDLYYRLSAFVLKVAPLRERDGDIALLAEHFLKTRDFSRHAPKSWSRAALDLLMGYSWPGNVRELRNIVERAALVSGAETEIRPAHCGQLGRRERPRSEFTFSFDRAPTLEQIADVYLARLLEDGSLTREDIAKILGVSERNVYRMLERHRASHARIGGSHGLRATIPIE